jgi:methionyl-tRNA synthetase
MGHRFISAGWPYLYDVPGLHNCVPMLFADVVARHGRLGKHDVYFLCGSDDHGSRMEFVARGYGTTPEQLVRAKYDATLPLLERMGLSFDRFGRTSEPAHKDFVQNILNRLRARGWIEPRQVPVPWCDACEQFLPDRFVEGKCPHCGGRAYGNQCEAKRGCDRLIGPEELQDPTCALCHAPTVLRSSRHWVFSLARWVERATRGVASNPSSRDDVLQMVRQTAEQNPEVVITRDVRWGIPLPWEEPGVKTVYNWVDSLLAKVSHAGLEGPGREDAFFRDPDARKVFFLGRDGVPFYAVLFPALLEAAELGHDLGNWWIIPNDVFIYEGGVCSKSTGTGIWLAEALNTLPGDLWRFYVFYATARRDGGSRDVDFRWDRFCRSLQQELIEPLEALLKHAGAGLAGGAAALAPVEEAARRVDELLEEMSVGPAFATLLDGVSLLQAAARDGAASAAVRAGLERLLPLLGCYVPDSAARAQELLGKGPVAGERLFPAGAPRSRDVQRTYQKWVDERRAQRSIEESVTDARADALCVCPIDLTER